MTERPVLFSSQMIPRLLDGSKTQTRRMVRLPPNPGEIHIDPGGTVFGPGPYLKVERTAKDGEPTMHPRIRCPYGYPGDVLWVREAWALYSLSRGYLYEPLSELQPRCYGDGPPRLDDLRIGDTDAVVQYRAHPTSYEELQRSPGYTTYRTSSPKRWRPGIHMPKWASRISLEITEVRVQRLQDISEEDAKAEGVEPTVTLRKLYPSKHAAEVEQCSYREGFQALWGEINGKRASWDENQLVWAISFRKLQ